MGLLTKVLRIGEGKILKSLKKEVAKINLLEQDYKKFSDEELKKEGPLLKERYQKGESLENLAAEAFAAVREAARRTLAMRPFDVQLMGGLALAKNNIAEMKTGEGKTLVATMPAFLYSLTGKGVHIVTVNDYLAKYQSDIMGRVFNALGVTCGCLYANQPLEKRKEAYNCDITYGTNHEFGFDYLRDNMTWSKDQCVQRGRHYAIIDEVDSILIDEARTPLIISGPAEGEPSKWFKTFAKIAKTLNKDEDYEVDFTKKTIALKDSAITKVEDYLGIKNLYESKNAHLISFLSTSLKAKELFVRDKDYVVHNREVMIVDEHTGRIMHGRRYSEGQHQAIEAKEGLDIKQESQTYATTTLQNYFRLYKNLAGMTGTAMTEAAEFLSTYKLPVVQIPTHKPMIRKDNPDIIYATQKAKFNAIVKDIEERHKKGQPILIGTVSVEKSEYLSYLLTQNNIKHEVLNAKNHSREASIIASAGKLGSVTVATNMAGRGTDIMLGGNSEFLTVEYLSNKGLSAHDDKDEYNKAWNKEYARISKECSDEAKKVIALGGLYVLGTERHDARRIDNQLRGRSGRQGDPGESRFYLSLEDPLMLLFNPTVAKALLSRYSGTADLAIESRFVSKSIANAQTQIEAQNAEIRKNLVKYDDIINSQRIVIYGDRRKILEGADISSKIQDFLSEIIRIIVKNHTGSKHSFEWDLNAITNDLNTVYPVGITPKDIQKTIGDAVHLSEEWLVKEYISDARIQYRKKESHISSPIMREIERKVMLMSIDTKWKDHLYEMDCLKQSIGLRAMAQRNPLLEYQREAFSLFSKMITAIKESTVRVIFRSDIKVNEPQNVASKPLQYKGAEETDITESPLLGQNANIQLSPVAGANDGELTGNAKRPLITGNRTQRRRAQKTQNKQNPPKR